MVFTTLNTVWNTEISTLLMVLCAQAASAENRTNMTIPKITAPTTLKSRWITAARLAVRLAPILESSAVTQVPMFCPRVMKIADCQLTMPFKASVCRIPTEAEELWMMAVTTAPVSIPKIGLLPSTMKAVENISASR